MKSLIVGCMTLLLIVSLAFGQDYVGDQTCQECHANMPETGFFEGYMNSGHPWKLSNTAGQTPADDFWPHTPVPPLPIAYGAQLEWQDVSYVIGNFYWKARFVDEEGYIYTGFEDETTQWNVQAETWSAYHAGEVDKPYNCGRCHTTGYDPDGVQDPDMPGLIGSWTEPGIRCEACHGPGSEHADNPSDISMPGGIDCAGCHYRDADFRMPWKDGFMRHHQQSEDLAHSPHDGVLTCNSCHNPHRSTLYNDGGLRDAADCSNCHPGDASNSFYAVEDMEDLDCIDCHMPFMAKSAVASADYVGDVRGHLFAIMTDPIAAEDNTYEDGGSLFWNQEDDGSAYATLDYACFACHESMTLADAADYATDIHTDHNSAVGETVSAVPDEFAIDSVYPNPFNPATTIEYTLNKPFIVNLTVFDMNGRQVASLYSGPQREGTHTITFDGSGLSSGVYFANLKAGNQQEIAKMILMK